MFTILICCFTVSFALTDESPEADERATTHHAFSSPDHTNSQADWLHWLPPADGFSPSNIGVGTSKP